MREPPCVTAACSNLCKHPALDIRLSEVPDKVGVGKTGVKMILPSERSVQPKRTQSKGDQPETKERKLRSGFN